MTNYSTNFILPSFDAWSSVSSPAGSSVPPRLNNLKATKAPALPKWDHLFNESVANVFNDAHQERMKKEADTETFFSKYISEGNGIITDLLSIVRNSTSATALFKGAEATAKVATPVAGMAVAGGAMTSFSGLNGMRKAGENLYQDYQHENLEGGFVHGTQGLQSMSLATLGGSMVASNAAVLAGAGAVAAGATMGIVVSGFAMYGLFGIVTGYGLGVNAKFRYELNQKENESMLETMVWLASQVRSGETEAELQQKWDQFAFRTSEACCRYVREEITPELLKGLQNNEQTAIDKAQKILDEVKLANGKQLLKYTIYAALTILGTTAFICSMIFTGPVVPVLFAIGAALWLLVDASKVHKKLGDLIIGKSDIPPVEVAPAVSQSSTSKKPEVSLSSNSNFEDVLTSIFKPMVDLAAGLSGFVSSTSSKPA